MAYYGRTEAFRDFFFAQETGGVNQGNVGVSGVMDAPIPLPPPMEQKKIVSLIRECFSRVDRLNSEVSRTGLLLDRLDQALLAKAFRGELLEAVSDETISRKAAAE